MPGVNVTPKQGLCPCCFLNARSHFAQTICSLCLMAGTTCCWRGTRILTKIRSYNIVLRSTTLGASVIHAYLQGPPKRFENICKHRAYIRTCLIYDLVILLFDFVMNDVQAEGLMDSEGNSLDLDRPVGGIANEQEGNFNMAVEDGMNQEKVSGSPVQVEHCKIVQYFMACTANALGNTLQQHLIMPCVPVELLSMTQASGTLV